MYGLSLRSNTDFVINVLDESKDKAGKYKNLIDNQYIKCEVINLIMPGNEFMKPYNRVLNNPKFHPNKNVHKFWAEEFSKWFDKRYKLNDNRL